MNENEAGQHFNEESVIRKGNRYDCPLNKEELGTYLQFVKIKNQIFVHPDQQSFCRCAMI